MVKGKGQTRSWPIIVPLPAGQKYEKNTNEDKNEDNSHTPIDYDNLKSDMEGNNKGGCGQ
jgi:hypothetical protein